MELGKGSHKRFTDAYPDAASFNQAKFCPLFMEDLKKETEHDEEFLGTFVRLPKLNPGDAVFFNGMTYHRPLPLCRRGCNRTNSRRITLRYIAGERTSYRNDIPSAATHYSMRWCPSYILQLMGYECRFKAGDRVLDKSEMPIVVDLHRNRSIPTDGIGNNFFMPPPLVYFWGSGPRVHHDTCGVISSYLFKTLRRLLYRLVPSVDWFIFADTPDLRPGEEEIFD